MATITLLQDDIDGTTEDVEHIEFTVDGASYAIDLGPGNAIKFRDALSLYIEHAQTLGGTAAPRRQRATTTSSARPAHAPTDKAQLTALREWARKNGYGVSDRGRVSKQIRDAFEAAH